MEEYSTIKTPNVQINDLTRIIQAIAAQMQHILNHEGKTAIGQVKIRELKVLYDHYVRERSKLETMT